MKTSVKQSVKLVFKQNQEIEQLNSSPSDRRICAMKTLPPELVNCTDDVEQIDGIPCYPILLANQTDASFNGLWYVSVQNR